MTSVCANELAACPKCQTIPKLGHTATQSLLRLHGPVYIYRVMSYGERLKFAHHVIRGQHAGASNESRRVDPFARGQ
ncbi:hypothetical protein EVAR_43427_1 [Eumeta japonica]|uniref:Uncharacterized protein n=1 Tax=Eumeta variegata TaxID=151549 RepID=A0A4C1WWW6_EUMVA|nr:hypothetical protein EVAR_43427_1 [Eumeta japonica]